MCFLIRTFCYICSFSRGILNLGCSFFSLFFSLHVFVFIYSLPSPCLDMNKHFSSLELLSTYSVQAEALYQVFSVHSQR